MQQDSMVQIPYDKMSESFAAALSYFLKYRPFPNMTQTKLAEKVGVTQGYITKLASGKMAGSEEVRRKIAAVYGYDGSGVDRIYDEFVKIGYTIITQQAENKDTKKATAKENLNIKLRQAHLKLLINQTMGIMEQFEDKDTACGINRILLDIERHDPQRLLEIYEHVKIIQAFIQNEKND